MLHNMKRASCRIPNIAKELANRAVQNITTLLSDYRRGEILRSGIKLAIFGPPNAGKSSLLNLLGVHTHSRRESAEPV